MSVENTCWGCREDQPNQMAHMEPGGCLYENYEFTHLTLLQKLTETTCEGCRDQDYNELAHMEPGGCLYRPRYSVEESDDDTIPEEIVKQSIQSVEKIKIEGETYYYDKKTKILYTDIKLEKPICKYDLSNKRLLPL